MVPIVSAAHNSAALTIQRPLGRDLKGEPTDWQQMAAQGRLGPFARSPMNDRVGWLPTFRLKALNGWIAPISVVPGRLPVAQMQTFGEVWR
jgi:hypothetical protein